MEAENRLGSNEKFTNFAVNTSTHEAKLKELLHKINSIEIKLSSDATKEFIKLLKDDNYGGEFLRCYVNSTSKFSELFSAIKIRDGKPGLHLILKLISVILGHSDGQFLANDKGRLGVSLVLDKFARCFVEERLDVVYRELSSKDKKRQNAALLVMGSIVRRGSGLASEVAKKFDFKLKGFSKLSEYDWRKNDKKRKRFGNDDKRKYVTRPAFVRFAMSFLEVGKPGLLRWVLQQREMYSGVFRVLGEDDDETVVYVLSVLRDRVLVEESLVPPALRSVLFGSLVLEQLADISLKRYCGPTAELAHEVLHMVCTDPCNGLMPDLKGRLRGNPKRLLQLMKKLKATEFDGGHHRELLLAIVKGWPSLGSLYLKEFPYSLEDYASPSWFSTVSLAANLISLMNADVPFDFRHSQSDDSPPVDSVGMQTIKKIISSRSLSRTIINKGLLHSDFLVKNGTLRLLLEILRLFDVFLRAINLYCAGNHMIPGWESFKQEIQNEIQTFLPDSQVFLTLLSSLSSHSRTTNSCLKKTAEKGKMKKLKMTVIDEDADIIVGGISSAPDSAFPGDGEIIMDSEMPDASDGEMDFMNVISELWGFDQCCGYVTALKDAEIFFHSKLLDAIKLYIRILPTALEGSFDFFMNRLSNPLELSSNLLSSLLSLLVEYIRWSPGSNIASRTPQMMYKHLQPFLNLLLYSPSAQIKEEAFILARAAMASTGAFDRNLNEIVIWFLFLPGYSPAKSPVEIHGEMLKSFSTVVMSFLCDAISTVGNNLFKSWHAVSNHIFQINEFRDISPEFSPLVLCILQKCVRLLGSESGTFSLPEKTMISAYVCNTLKYLLQTQVDARLLAALIGLVLSEGLQDCSSVDLLCEWRPLKILLLLTDSILHQNICCLFFIDYKDPAVDIPFIKALDEIRKIVHSGEGGGVTTEIMKAFYSAIICTTSDAVLKNLPAVMAISQHIGAPLSFLSSIIFLDQNFFGVLKLWPDVFLSGLEKAVSMYNSLVEDNDTYIEGTMLNADSDASEATEAIAFALFLRQAPFHVIFPAIISSGGHCLVESSMIKNFLKEKLSECTSDFVISYLRLLLFWFYQIQLSSKLKPSAKLKEFAEICYILIKHLLDQLLLSTSETRDSHSAEIIQEVAQTIFCHPAVEASLTYPLGGDDDSNSEELTDGNFRGTLQDFFMFSQKRVHSIDHHILDILRTTFCNFLFPSRGKQCLLKVEDGASMQLAKAFKTLMQMLYLELKDKLDLCIRTGNVLPVLQPFHALHALMDFASPFEYFELARWIFDSVEVNDLTSLNSAATYALSVGFSIALDAFKSLSIYLQQPMRIRKLFYVFWEMEETNLDVNLFEEIYIKICKFATNSGLDFAYTCLLEAVHAVYKQKYTNPDLLDPLSMVFARVVTSTPTEIVSHCIHGTSQTKAKLLCLLVELSPQHLSVLGCLFSGIMDKNVCANGKKAYENSEMPSSDEDFLLLLPTAHLLLNSAFLKSEKQFHKQLADIPSFYSRILLNGFRNWNSFVSGFVFQEKYDDFLPSSSEELVSLLGASLLGKALHMLRRHFASSGGMKMEERLKIFSCILTGSNAQDQLVDNDVNKIEIYSFIQLLNLINRVAAKVVFCRMMLFSSSDLTLHSPKEADDLKTTGVVSRKEDRYRMRFVLVLVRTWQCILKKFPSVSDFSKRGQSLDCLQLCRYLELFLLETIFESIDQMQNALIELETFPFLEHLMKSSLIYRFEDPTTISILRKILITLPQGKLSSAQYLQLLLGHSQFGSTILSVTEFHGSQISALSRPMPSILSLVTPYPKSNNDLKSTHSHMKQLEILKLLRTLIDCYTAQDMGINLRELYLLILTSYGATLSEIDLEIHCLMDVIESIDNTVSEDLAEVDHLWGNAASRIRKERAIDGDISSNIMADAEALEEHRKTQFREILSINPKMCAATVINFPYDRSLTTKRQDPKKFQIQMVYFPGVEQIELYDPIFILKFAYHNLSSGYVEPLEFARLGLLAVAFISMSSPDIEIRKLSDACLSMFKDALENCKKKKDLMRLHFLLSYIQNGVKEPLQRIPSVIALFAAESSFLLLDPSNDHFTTLTNHMMRSSMVDMKSIPLFHALFQNSSVNFRAERLWMLRLTCAGLNLEDDAQIYISNSIPKILLSFYSTPLADNETKELILLVLKKSVKLDRMVRHLVESCGLFPFLSSLLSKSWETQDASENNTSSLQLVLAIEVVFDVLSRRDTIESEWFEKCAFEQLTELPCHLHKILVGGSKLIKDNIALVEPILQIIISALKMQQNREISQPHFTLSFEGVFQIYQAFNSCGTLGSGWNSKYGLEAILNSTPPVDIFHTNQEKLSGFLMWAVSTAMKSDPENILHLSQNHHDLMSDTDKSPSKESVISKLLRWLVSAVILGKLSWKLNDVNTKFSDRPSLQNLESFLEYVDHRSAGCKNYEFDCEEVLAATIFYLKQLIGLDRTVPSSVVSALCVLLCSPSKCSGIMRGFEIDIASLWVKVCCPIEANPEWRWSFDKPWNEKHDHETSDLQKTDEYHACLTLLAIISNILKNKPFDSQVLSHHNPVNFERETRIVETNE